LEARLVLWDVLPGGIDKGFEAGLYPGVVERFEY
jgi:hypothetical protein